MLTLEAARRFSHCYEPQWGGHQYGRPKPRGKLVAQRYLLVSHGPRYKCAGAVAHKVAKGGAVVDKVGNVRVDATAFREADVEHV